MKERKFKDMKILVSTENELLVIDKSRKEWEMNGRKGISYKAICHCKIGDEVQVEQVKVSEEVYYKINPMTMYKFKGLIDVKNSRLEFTEVYDSKTK